MSAGFLSCLCVHELELPVPLRAKEGNASSGAQIGISLLTEEQVVISALRHGSCNGHGLGRAPFNWRLDTRRVGFAERGVSVSANTAHRTRPCALFTYQAC